MPEEIETFIKKSESVSRRHRTQSRGRRTKAYEDDDDDDDQGRRSRGGYK